MTLKRKLKRMREAKAAAALLNDSGMESSASTAATPLVSVNGDSPSRLSEAGKGGGSSA